jgi:hypothetical protein
LGFGTDCREIMKEEYPNPYTSCDDPHVDYVRKDWRGNVFELKSTRYSKLNYDCKSIVDDLVTSSQLESFKHWDTNFRRKYYTRAIFMVYEMGKESNEGILLKLKRFFKLRFESSLIWILSKF